MKCLVCNEGHKLKFTIVDGHLSNLKKHKCFSAIEEQKALESTTGDTISTTAATSVQTTLDGGLVHGPKLPEDVQKKITHALLKFLIVDGRPLFITESKTFRNFCYILNPRYRPPCVETLESYVDKLLLTGTSGLKTFVNSLSAFSFTSDLYLTENHVHLIFIFLHYIQGAQRKKLLLASHDTSALPHVDAKALEQIFVKTMNDFNLKKEKLVAFTADGGSNLIKLVEKHLQIPYLHCIPHVVNLIVQAAIDIPEVNELRMKMRSVVSFFHCSTLGFSVLTANQIDDNKLRKLDNVVYALIMEVATRRDSFYDMIDRIHLVFEQVNDALKECKREDLVMTPLTKEIIEELMEVLKPFKIISKEFQGDPTPLLSMIIPSFRSVELQLKNLNLMSTTAIKLRNQCADNLVHYAKEYKTNSLVLIGNYLDPRTRSFNTYSFEKEMVSSFKTSAISAVKGAISQFPIDNQSSPTAVDQQRSSSHCAHSLEYLFDNIHVDQVVNSQSESDLEKEMKEYESEQVNFRFDDEIQRYWALKSTSSRLLSKLAFRIFSVPSSAVICEQEGSKARRICQNRAKLKGSTVCKLLFLQEHFPPKKYT